MQSCKIQIMSSVKTHPIELPSLEALGDMSVSKVSKFFEENKKNFTLRDLDVLKDLVEKDGRAGIEKALFRIIKEQEKIIEETNRVAKLYKFQDTIAANPGANILGLDEVGRGPLAGPLTVGGVILNRDSFILGLNDSKKISPKNRDKIAKEIFEKALCAKTFSVPPKYIDNLGMTECLKRAFRNVVDQIEADGVKIDLILLDGNPLSFDAREVNVIKGDAKCASISAASIIAKVTRDTYMDKISNKYPQYNFTKNKGYGTAEHIDAIKTFGLSSVHRKSFCSSFMQMSLF